MTDARKPSVVAVTSDNAIDGFPITIRNLTTGGKTSANMNSSGQILYDLSNLSEWSDGDVIVIERHDRYVATTKVTLESTKNLPKLSLTTTADARPSMNL